MRRIPVSGGSWLLLAAMAVPLLLKGAKPLVKKVGKGMKDLGEKLMDEASESKPAPEAPSQPATQPKTAAPRKTPAQRTGAKSTKAVKAGTSTKKRPARPTVVDKAENVDEDKA